MKGFDVTPCTKEEKNNTLHRVIITPPLETRGGGASFWDAFQAGEIIGRGNGKEGVDVGTIHGWSAADLQCDLAGYLARLPEETYRTFYSDSATTLEKPHSYVLEPIE